MSRVSRVKRDIKYNAIICWLIPTVAFIGMTAVAGLWYFTILWGVNLILVSYFLRFHILDELDKIEEETYPAIALANPIFKQIISSDEEVLVGVRIDPDNPTEWKAAIYSTNSSDKD